MSPLLPPRWPGPKKGSTANLPTSMWEELDRIALEDTGGTYSRNEVHEYLLAWAIADYHSMRDAALQSAELDKEMDEDDRKHEAAMRAFERTAVAPPRSVMKRASPAGKPKK